MAPVLIVPADLRCEQIRGPELDAEMRRHSEDVQREIERRLMSGAWTCGLSTQPDVPRLPFYGIKCSPFC